MPKKLDGGNMSAHFWLLQRQDPDESQLGRVIKAGVLRQDQERSVKTAPAARKRPAHHPSRLSSTAPPGAAGTWTKPGTRPGPKQDETEAAMLARAPPLGPPRGRDTGVRIGIDRHATALQGPAGVP